MSNRKSLQRVLGDYKMPAFPAVAIKAMKLLRDERASLHDAANVIMGDPGISSSILTVVNSAASAIKHPVRNIPQATALLGRNQVESILVAVAAGRSLPSRSEHIEMKRFWTAAAQRASIARGFAATLHPATQSTSYTAGLLQDMAIPILMEVKKKDYAGLFRRWELGEGDIVSEERRRYNWDHAEVAGWMCEAWCFPDALAAGITAHHTVSSCQLGAEPAVRLVSLLRGSDDSKGVDALIETAVATYNLSSDTCMSIVNEGFALGAESARLFC